MHAIWIVDEVKLNLTYNFLKWDVSINCTEMTHLYCIKTKQQKAMGSFFLAKLLWNASEYYCNYKFYPPTFFILMWFSKSSFTLLVDRHHSGCNMYDVHWTYSWPKQWFLLLKANNIIGLWQWRTAWNIVCQAITLLTVLHTSDK